MHKEAKMRLIIVFCVILFFVATFIITIKRGNKISQYGIYTVAYFKENSNKWVIYEFSYKNKTYKAKNASGNNKKVVLIKFLPSDPSSNYVLQKVFVPKCFEIDSIPEEGWKELPVIVCKEK